MTNPIQLPLVRFPTSETVLRDRQGALRHVRVEKIDKRQAHDFIRLHHYARGCHNGPMAWGLLDQRDQLLGVIAFATPSSENVRASVFGPERKDWVTELHRLAIHPDCPKGTASWFIARGLRGLREFRPVIRGVLSFADTTEGHLGIVYQATNALYCGMTTPTRFYMDDTGRLRHPRQNGRNILLDEAAERGWRPVRRAAKHRYLFLVGSKSDRRCAQRVLKLQPQPYPKALPELPSTSAETA